MEVYLFRNGVLHVKFVYLGFPISNMRTSSAHHSFPNWLILEFAVINRDKPMCEEN